MEGISWKWPSIDGATVKAPLAQETVGPNPTDRGKKGSQRNLLVDGCGVPLSLVVSGANRHDVTQLEIVIERPDDIEQHLCADKGYYGDPALQIIISKGYTPHVKSRGEEIHKKKRTLVTNLEDGWSKSVIPGSTGSGKSWSAMKNST